MSSAPKDPITVAVTGGGGQIAYSLLPALVSGNVCEFMLQISNPRPSYRKIDVLLPFAWHSVQLLSASDTRRMRHQLWHQPSWLALQPAWLAFVTLACLLTRCQLAPISRSSSASSTSRPR